MSPRTRNLLEADNLFALKLAPGPGLCPVKGCRKPGHAGKMGLCHAHHQYRWRMRNPKRSGFTALRDHAVARGLKFTISYDYFLGITDAAGYWDRDVESRGEYPTIDRIKGHLGYEPGNLRVVSLSSNVAAGNRERFLPEYVQSILVRKRERGLVKTGAPVSGDRCPF